MGGVGEGKERWGCNRSVGEVMEVKCVGVWA